jgi:NAD(P)-dependent dehydrogenase (short-subunit alcohol dehydrogenase family)
MSDISHITDNNYPAVHVFCANHSDTYKAINPLAVRLSGKTVVITGASTGIGRAAAISYAKAGASNIVITARSDLSAVEKAIQEAAAAAKRASPRVLTVRADVTVEEDVKRLEAAIRETVDSVDILINNAGWWPDTPQPFNEFNAEEWWRVVSVCLLGSYHVSRYLSPLILLSETKTVINVCSHAALQVVPATSPYGIAKFAQMRLADFMLADAGAEGLLAISLHPGLVLTENAARLPEQFHRHMTDTPELSGDFMVWLGAERREWLSGRYVSANWDVKELESRRDEIVKENKLRFQLVI